MEGPGVPVTPEQQIAQARSDVIAGRLSSQEFGQMLDRHYAIEASGQSAAPAPISPEQARAGIEALRQQRLEDKVTTAEYHRQMERLQAQAAGQQPPAPQLDPTIAPAQPHEYQMRYEHGAPDSPEALEADTEIRTAFSSAGVPRQLGGPIADAFEANSRRLEGLPPAAIEAHRAEVSNQLRAAWGSDFDRRVGRVAALVSEAVDKFPRLSALIDARPEVLADVAVMHYLDRVADIREAQRAEP